MTTTSSPDHQAIEHDPRWHRILARDRSADGTFWYSVLTTGVYCRPSCPSRRCNPANVTIHDTLAAARATGCRPCRRCRPDCSSDPSLEAITRACRLIETAPENLTLKALSAAVGLSAHHFHRLFKAATGVTPKGYADACRAGRLRAQLGAQETITQAFNDAGFGSSGRFYENAAGLLGMTPTRYRRGGEREALRFAIGACSLGAILVASSAKGIAAILIGDDPDGLMRALRDRFPQALLVGGDTAYETLVAQVIGLVEAPHLGTTLPLDVRGTAFQHRVWQALRAIPPGETVSYAELARRIGAPGSVRAVAGACAANALAVAIPCHRVVRSDGGLAGYRWGVERKRTLLAREAGLGGPQRSPGASRE